NILKTLIAAASLIILASTSSAQNSKISIAELPWSGANAIAHIIQAIIIGPMGGEAEIIKGTSDSSIIFASMDKGNGYVDVHPDIYMPIQAHNWNRYVKENKTVVVNKPYKGTQGMFVPNYLAAKITSFEDLANPKIAKIFDQDGDGKGEYWAGDTSWTSTKEWQIKFKSYGLEKLWEPLIISDLKFQERLRKSYNAQVPILFYYWTPEWIFSGYDLSQLDEPIIYEGCRTLDLEKENWLEVSTFKCKHSDTEIWVGHSKSLEERNPAVAKMLTNIAINPETVNEWIMKIRYNEKNAQNIAKNWVEENMDIVNLWING
ncbi:MAG: ABC transporter substrate-binding protein, partial [Rhodobacterales bacterium]